MAEAKPSRRADLLAMPAWTDGDTRQLVDQLRAERGEEWVRQSRHVIDEQVRYLERL